MGGGRSTSSRRLQRHGVQRCRLSNRSPDSTNLAYTCTVTGEAATASANSALEILIFSRALPRTALPAPCGFSLRSLAPWIPCCSLNRTSITYLLAGVRLPKRYQIDTNGPICNPRYIKYAPLTPAWNTLAMESIQERLASAYRRELASLPTYWLDQSRKHEANFSHLAGLFLLGTSREYEQAATRIMVVGRETRRGEVIESRDQFKSRWTPYPSAAVSSGCAADRMYYTCTVTGEAATASANNALEILMFSRALSSISL